MDRRRRAWAEQPVRRPPIPADAARYLRAERRRRPLPLHVTWRQLGRVALYIACAAALGLLAYVLIDLITAGGVPAGGTP
jgi:hypothetical protein